MLCLDLSFVVVAVSALFFRKINNFTPNSQIYSPLRAAFAPSGEMTRRRRLFFLDFLPFYFSLIVS